VDDFAVGADHELGWLDDAAAVFPPRPECLRDFARHALADLERNFVLNFPGFFARIDAGKDDLCADLIYFRLLFFKAG